jgi:hypothetical protein
MKTLWRVLSALPGIVWVAALVLSLIAGGLAAIYYHGKTVGEASVHRKTLRDSVDLTAIVHRRTITQTNAVRAEAQSKHRMADSSRVIRSRIREAVIPSLATLPDPVVRLIEADDQQIRRDSVALAAYVAVDTTWVREREVAADLDTLRQHQVALSPSHGHRAWWFVAGAVTATVLTFALAAAR